MPKQMIKNYAPALISAIILAAFAILGSSLGGFSYESTLEQILKSNAKPYVAKSTKFSPRRNMTTL